MPEIIINLTDEEMTILERSIKMGKGRHLLLLSGYRDVIKDDITVEEYFNLLKQTLCKIIEVKKDIVFPIKGMDKETFKKQRKELFQKDMFDKMSKEKIDRIEKMTGQTTEQSTTETPSATEKKTKTKAKKRVLKIKKQ